MGSIGFLSEVFLFVGQQLLERVFTMSKFTSQEDSHWMLFLVHCARSKQIHQPLLIQFAFTRSAVQKHSIVNCSLGAIQIFRHGALSLGFEHTLEERQITLEDHSSWSFWSSLTERNDGVQWLKKKKPLLEGLVPTY